MLLHEENKKDSLYCPLFPVSTRVQSQQQQTSQIFDNFCIKGFSYFYHKFFPLRRKSWTFLKAFKPRYLNTPTTQALFPFVKTKHVQNQFFHTFNNQTPITFFLQSMSADLLKQIKIKSSVLKRLRKEYASYEKEAKSIQDKLAHYQHQLQLVGKDEEMETAIRKHNQFLVESQAVQANVKQKLVESFEALALFISEKGQDESLANSVEKEEAEGLLLEIQTYLETLE